MDRATPEMQNARHSYLPTPRTGKTLKKFNRFAALPPEGEAKPAASGGERWSGASGKKKSAAREPTRQERRNSSNRRPKGRGGGGEEEVPSCSAWSSIVNWSPRYTETYFRVPGTNLKGVDRWLSSAKTTVGPQDDQVNWLLSVWILRSAS